MSAAVHAAAIHAGLVVQLVLSPLCSWKQPFTHVPFKAEKLIVVSSWVLIVSSLCSVIGSCSEESRCLLVSPQDQRHTRVLRGCVLARDEVSRLMNLLKCNLKSFLWVY